MNSRFEGRKGKDPIANQTTRDASDEMRRMRDQAAIALEGVQLGLSATITALAGVAFSRLVLRAFATPGAGTYTPTAGMKACLVISTGGGGGAGGADTTGGAGVVGPGAGGGAGGTCLEVFTAAQIGASQPYVVGAGGAAGSDTGGDGGAGGTTTFGSPALHSGNGGAGGLGSGTSAAPARSRSGGAGGSGSGGTVNAAGGGGGDGVGGSINAPTDGAFLTFATSGHGGASFWGGGGGSRALALGDVATAVTSAGRDGRAPGSGGSGAVALNAGAGVIGGVGIDGIIVVLEAL